VVFAAESGFGAFLAGYPECFRIQSGAPFSITFSGFIVH
jgi:hypothetical protein